MSNLFRLKGSPFDCVIVGSVSDVKRSIAKEVVSMEAITKEVVAKEAVTKELVVQGDGLKLAVRGKEAKFVVEMSSTPGNRLDCYIRGTTPGQCLKKILRHNSVGSNF